MNPKSLVYPAVIIVCLLGLVGLVLLSLQFTVTIEPIEPETSSLPETVPPQPRSPSGKLFSTPAPKPTQQEKQNTPPVPNLESTSVAGGTGALRMSNQTEQPVRVALLARDSAPTSADGQPNYREPAHWDFAPGEGSRQGLVLSLPDGNLKLKKGDILVAFAQDGSHRYWGPYVVGETTVPVWNSKTSEWQLILK